MPVPSDPKPMHFVSASCQGETCNLRVTEPPRRCGKPATHKVGEEILHDDPNQIRHNLTAYVCCSHFARIVGPAAPCS